MDTIVKKAFNTITIDEYNSVEGFIAGSFISSLLIVSIISLIIAKDKQDTSVI